MPTLRIISANRLACLWVKIRSNRCKFKRKCLSKNDGLEKGNSRTSVALQFSTRQETNLNNFLATCYRQDQMHVENWLYGLMKFYLDTTYDDTTLYYESLEYLDEIFAEEYPMIN